ncbi:hypothetical protein BSKO_10975 [Bryopsis sp. KO-2023]|nr:hypothetical protein BSKO_10975 [Bryopsis sp. KO-2023]
MLASGDRNRSGTRLIGPKDVVIAALGTDTFKSVSVEDAKFNNVAGSYCPQDWVGKPYGSCVYPTLGYNLIHRVRPMYLLAPTPELWTRALKHRTQILYLPDISLVCTFLELKPGCIVLESGTGSGSLSHSIARAVNPSGHLYTFEYHAERAKIAQQEFEMNGMGLVATVTERNIEGDGFPESFHGKADALFLDLPGPWKAVASAAKCLKGGGRFCSFSPCIEQIQKTAEELGKHGFTSLRTMECLLREYSVRTDALVTDLEAYQKSLEEARARKIQSKKRPRCPTPKSDAGASNPRSEPSQSGAEAMDVDSLGDDKSTKEDGGTAPSCQETEEPTKEVEAAPTTQGLTPKAEILGPQIPLPKVMHMKGHTGYLLFARSFVPCNSS